MKPAFKTLIIRTTITFALISLISLSALYALSQVKQDLQNNIIKSLQTVVETTGQALEIWIKFRKIEIADIAKEQALIKSAQTLLKEHQHHKNVENSQTLTKLRAMMQTKLTRHSDNGFFIINTNRINVASMRDENLNDLNLIHQQRPSYLDRVFNGQTLFIPPIRSDVPLKTSTGKYRENLPTMFIATPLYNHNNIVFAVLTIRLNPAKDFNKIIQLGRIGDSGETYAFDKNANLLSESRFDFQLKDIGVLHNIDKGILTVRIADPGGNLIKGFIPPLPANERPLTVMAKSAISKRSNFNIDGYRDYRGVPVFGAWKWHNELEIGITTEIDVAEAMHPYQYTLYAFIVLIVVTLILCFSFAYLIRWLKTH